MQSFSEEEEDAFFDTRSSLSTGNTTPDSPAGEDQGWLRQLHSEFWRKDLKTVQERRSRFLHCMGFDDFVSTSETKEATCDVLVENMGAERVTVNSGAALDTLSPPAGDEIQSDLDSEKKFIIHDLGQDGLFSMPREVGSNKLISLQEFEGQLGLSCSFQKLMRKEAASSEEKHDGCIDGRKRKFRNWWRQLMAKRALAKTCKNVVFVKDTIRTTRVKVLRHKKRCLEFTAVHIGQEIRAHKGLIRTMKFNSSGCYIASGGEDGIVHIWQVREVEASCNCTTADESCEFVDKVKEQKLILGRKGTDCTVFAPIVVPRKVFKIDETPLQDFFGHTSDVLDLSWSNSDYLLTSSMDKTVRMWKVGCDGCLQIFQHNDYVTCVQFNPVDDNYFISGSIDGKVRIWDVSEAYVVHWTDVRDIVTAISYRPDGEGFVVGSLAGNCRLYNYSGNVMQLDKQFCVQGRKKSAGKLITGLQFSPDGFHRVMVTSADSKVRIFDGTDIIRKFRGLRRSKSQLSASFTSDGRYIVSIGADSNVYIWNYEGSPSSGRHKSVKSIRSCEHFFSEGVSVAAPWISVAAPWTGTDHTESVLSNNSLHLPSQPLKILEPSTWLWDSDFCLGAWLFADGLSRGSATWPEEKLLTSPEHSSQSSDHCHKHRDHQYDMHVHYRGLTYLSATWNVVIVTASCDGTIRTYHNYGLPLRL